MTPTVTTLATLESARYLELTTFRRDGRAVRTPLWFAADGDTILAYTDATSGKTKRIRNSSRVLVAPCDVRGRPTGPAVEGVATLTDAAGTRRVLDAIRRRYGWQARLVQWFSWSRTKDPGEARVGIEIRLLAADAA